MPQKLPAMLLTNLQPPPTMLSLSAVRLPFLMARRYLFSRKKMRTINIISGISVAGIAFCTAALLCTLGVFSGFRDLMNSLYTQFDPPLMVTPAKGKYFEVDDPAVRRMATQPEVAAASYTMTDNALILFQGRPTVITVKGVDNQFEHVTHLRSILYGKGSWRLEQAGINYGTPGIGLAPQLGGLNYGTLQICAPRGGERVNLANPIENFSVADITASGVCFNVNQRKYDENYLLVSLDFARTLFEKPAQATALELSLKPGVSVESLQARLQQMGEGRYTVRNQMEQQEDMYHFMQIEKLVAYMFLSFILLIACFNIVGSVSMLICDKRDDMATLTCLGADRHTVFRIFLYEGRLITLLGALIGLVLGLTLCWAQQQFGLIKMGGAEGTFIVDAYPVSIQATDALLVLVTVVAIGFASQWYPVRYLTRRLIPNA